MQTLAKLAVEMLASVKHINLFCAIVQPYQQQSSYAKPEKKNGTKLCSTWVYTGQIQSPKINLPLNTYNKTKSTKLAQHFFITTQAITQT